jgi:hypothetical protein
MSTDLTPGTTVRILVRAGLVEHPMDARFAATAEPGTEGVYDCPHPNSRLGDDWHLVMVSHPDYNHVLYAPLHRDHMEVAE